MHTASPIIEHREHDHLRCATDALGHAEEISRRQGLRFTKKRREVLEALLTSHVPASAYDIIDRLAGHGTQLVPTSVYRALDFLVDNGFAHRIESKNAYVACDRGPECTPEATLFLICDNCGAAGEATSQKLGRLVAEETNRRAFLPRLRVLEVRGLCARCQAD